MARRSDGLRPPVVSAPDLPDRLDPADAHRRAELLTAHIELSGDTELAHSTLEQCVLTGTAETLDLRGATLMDVELRETRVAALPARDANLRRVRISGGRIGTLDLSGARVDELELCDVRIDYFTLASARAVDVRIDRCRITTLDLPSATLTRLAFEGSRADEVDTRGMRAEHVDLRGLDALSFLDVTGLRGATMTLRQIEQLAPVFAAASGIDLRD